MGMQRQQLVCFVCHHRRAGRLSPITVLANALLAALNRPWLLAAAAAAALLGELTNELDASLESGQGIQYTDQGSSVGFAAVPFVRNGLIEGMYGHYGSRLGAYHLVRDYRGPQGRIEKMSMWVSGAETHSSPGARFISPLRLNSCNVQSCHESICAT
jgi:hypothetical protein